MDSLNNYGFNHNIYEDKSKVLIGKHCIYFTISLSFPALSDLPKKGPSVYNNILGFVSFFTDIDTEMVYPILPKNVATLELLVDKCIGCGKCKEVCPHSVFAIQDRKANITDKNACMECGACMNNCPVNAISVESGVGCVSAVIRGWLTNNEPSCDCSGDSDCC